MQQEQFETALKCFLIFACTEKISTKKAELFFNPYLPNTEKPTWSWKPVNQELILSLVLHTFLIPTNIKQTEPKGSGIDF